MVQAEQQSERGDGPGSVLFTGVGGSIGSAILERLRRASARVVALAHEPADGVELLADFSDDAELRERVAEVEGDLDHIVLAHGLLEPGPWSAVTPSAWRQLLDVNLNSIYGILHAALPKLRRGGSVVVISSTAAFDHSPVGGPHYTASKWALNGLVRHLAHDLGPSGIRINCVCPGLVDNPMGRMLLDDRTYEHALQEIPLRRAATSDEIASVVMFLLSSEASFITGAHIPVSGGYQ